MVLTPPSTSRIVAASEALYSEKVASLDEATLLMVFDDAPSTTVPRGDLEPAGIDFVDLLVRTGLCTSRGHARKTIDQGGAYVNNVRAEGDAPTISRDDLIADRYVVLRRGKREFRLVIFA